ncbi:hypothetical protein DPMN_165985 [Dreissena polymorpha]|uniref:Uncharacterized protein n=1 Tax=Dreissena polymorpha TaxID=45954 RepID=A0A9D4EVZ9_DREPO|nr:hypothetical protein DPMN_165985 [Dreissena polymorpha]
MEPGGRPLFTGDHLSNGCSSDSIVLIQRKRGPNRMHLGIWDLLITSGVCFSNINRKLLFYNKNKFKAYITKVCYKSCNSMLSNQKRQSIILLSPANNNSC